MSVYRYTVIENKLLTPTVRSIVMSARKDSKPLLFEPGQYASFSLHDSLRPTANRCFSIASSPRDRYRLEFSARTGGAYTNALARLTAGATVDVRGPYGDFIFKDHEQSDLVFLAGGIGITPFMSMMRYAADLSLPNKQHLIFSCRSQDDIPFFSELRELQQRNPNLRLTLVIAGGPTDKLAGLEVLTGRMDEAALRELRPDITAPTYMICGPSGYIAAMQNLLTRAGVPSGQIRSESFSQGRARRGSALMRWPLNAYALSGLSLIAAGAFVVGSDLSQTLPFIQDDLEQMTTSASQLEGIADNVLANIESIPPQVDTDTTATPVEEHVTVTDTVTKPSTATTKTVTTTPTPAVVTPTPTPVTPTPVVVTPTPTPTPTTKTTARARTRTS
ncbi:hypothetical protein H6783_03625 [Candidatus Nomurabacteria bacterium]|nr:hypothetical protein [Candidatus Nomurabacteria bacterium]